MAARIDSANFDFFYGSILEALPNTSFEWNGRTTPASDLAVVGKLVSVEPLVSFADPIEKPDLAGEGDVSSGVPVDHDDPRALWRTFALVVEIDEVLGYSPGIDLSSQATFVVAADAIVPIEVVRADLLAHPNVVAIGSIANAVDVGSEDLAFRVGFNGAFWFLVSSDEVLSAPALDSYYAESLQVTALTLDDLRAAAAAEPRVLEPHWTREVTDEPTRSDSTD